MMFVNDGTPSSTVDVVDQNSFAGFPRSSRRVLGVLGGKKNQFLWRIYGTKTAPCGITIPLKPFGQST